MKNMFLVLALYMGASFSMQFNNDDELFAFIKKILPKNPVILESGGHHAEDTVKMKLIWPGAVNYVFEPVQGLFEKCVENTKHLRDVHLYRYALSTYVGNVDFYCNPNNDGACSIGAPVSWNANEFLEKTFTVPCITLNAWKKKYNPLPIDFMWLDMEGHELYALRHGLDVLSTVKVIYTEVGFVEIRKGSCLYHDLRAFLERLGFREVCKLHCNGNFGNALFVR